MLSSQNGFRCRGAQRCPRSVNYCDRNLTHDLRPPSPEMKLKKIIGSHDPDKAHAGTATAQVGYQIGGVAQSQPRLNIGDDNARVASQTTRGGEAL